MALIERIMGYPFEVDAQRKIPVHELAALCNEINLGPRTVAQVKSYYAMDAPTAAEFDRLVAMVTGTAAQRHQTIFQLEQIFLLAEQATPFYDTPEAVRSRLNLPTP